MDHPTKEGTKEIRNMVWENIQIDMAKLLREFGIKDLDTVRGI